MEQRVSLVDFVVRLGGIKLDDEAKKGDGRGR